MNTHLMLVLLSIIIILTLTACGPAANTGQPDNKIRAVAVLSFLTDIAQNVAGERFHVDSLIPLGLDPHAFEPAPADVALIARSKILIVNGAGMEEWLDDVLDSAGGQRTVIVASQGLTSRPIEESHPEHAEEHKKEETVHHLHHEGDPHFWLDPIKVIRYVENIRNGFIEADPAGKDIYTKNAENYITQLKELDAWIEDHVEIIPPERRLLVTNHESLGYFAHRYGFKIIGTIIPSFSTGASPSAQQVVDLLNKIRSSDATAIFLETGTNPKLAEQIAAEAEVKIVTDIYTHSLSVADGNPSTYLDMMRYNTNAIVESLK